MYKTLTAQTIHYFARPQSRVLREPLDNAAAWKASDVLKRDDWREVLSDADVAEIELAVAHAKQTGKPMGELTKRDFPLPTLGRKIDRWRQEVRSGRGFQVLRGAPVTRWSEADAELFFWCFGQHLGLPGAQNPQADLLGHVRDTGESPDEVRHYRTRVNINFHCDAADVVGLLCLRQAKRGGLSRIASSVAVYNELLRRRHRRTPSISFCGTVTPLTGFGTQVANVQTLSLASKKDNRRFHCRLRRLRPCHQPRSEHRWCR